MSREYPARPIASAAAVILRGSDVLLIRRGYPPRQGIWTFPGGAIEVGETAREACSREVLEETGLRVRVGAVIEAVDVMQPEEGRWRYHYTIMDFLAEPLPGSDEPQAASDASDARWAPVDALDDYGLTPIALHVLRRALWMRANGEGECLAPDAVALI
ncbi:MAG TPA: NUDIX hydrolase [Armatimonadota bacterium]